MSTAAAIRSVNRVGNLRFNRVVSAWIIASFLGSLIICCELFASPSVHAAETGQTEVETAGIHDHNLDNGKRHDHSLSSPSDGLLCADNYLPEFATLKFLSGNSFDEKPFIQSIQNELKVSFVQGAPSSESFVEAHMGSPPLYLLYHRLLIAHLLV